MDRGSRVFTWGAKTGGGRGVNRAPQNRGGGVGKRAQLTRPLISHFELAPKALKQFLSIENGQFFPQIHGKR